MSTVKERRQPAEKSPCQSQNARVWEGGGGDRVSAGADRLLCIHEGECAVQ